MIKGFSSEDHARYDQPARQTAKRFWKANGYECYDHENEYDVDLVVKGKGRNFFCEPEVKTGWYGLKFPFETLHIPIRKAKFLDRPTVFIVFNSSLHRGAVVSRQYLKSAPRKKVPNNRVPTGELFFDIPVDQVKFFSFLGV